MLQERFKLEGGKNVSVDDILSDLTPQERLGGHRNYSWNSELSDALADISCSQGGRCRSIPSLDFSHVMHGLPTIHLDTANPQWLIPLDATIRGGIDYVLGHTVFSDGFPY